MLTKNLKSIRQQADCLRKPEFAEWIVVGNTNTTRNTSGMSEKPCWNSVNTLLILNRWVAILYDAGRDTKRYVYTQTAY